MVLWLSFKTCVRSVDKVALIFKCSNSAQGRKDSMNALKIFKYNIFNTIMQLPYQQTTSVYFQSHFPSGQTKQSSAVCLTFEDLLVVVVGVGSQ